MPPELVGEVTDRRRGGPAPRGAAPLLCRDDPGPRRADPVATPPTTAARPPGASRRSSSRRSTCRRRGRPAVRRRRPRSTGSRRSASRAARRRSRRRGVRPASRSSLSFSGIDDYLTCPMKYKLGHVVRVPVPPHHAMIYGAALHRAVQEFHRRHARGDVMSEEELVDVVRRGLEQRGVPLARSRGGAPGRRPGDPAPVPGGPARARRGRPGLRRARVLLLARRRPDPRALGPGRHRAGRRRDRRRRAGIARPRRTPTRSRRRSSSLRPRAGDDHRLQDQRRPGPGESATTSPRLAPAPDLRDGLRGGGRPPAGCRPAPLPRHRASSAGPRSTPGVSPADGSGSRSPRRGSAPATTRRGRAPAPAATARSGRSVRPSVAT